MKKFQIIKNIFQKTKLMIICNPNNPAGTVYSKKTLNLFNLAKKFNFIILCDEAYSEFTKRKNFFFSLYG